ncbi:hypothetical protein [Haloarchaeobius sp. DFWS5]|uniref:hypothetical protein n=1 Tax=Haloarchaeobius sp. DFWS5 TaxID=3446114 RepID=UPI003EB7B110
MLSILAELVPELASIAVYAVVAAALAALGTAAELASWHSYLTEGLSVLTIWYAVIGLLVLYAAVYVVGYERLRPRVLQALAD